MNRRFNVGDKVVVDYIKSEEEYRNRCCVLFGNPDLGAALMPPMYKYMDTEAIVTNVERDDCYDYKNGWFVTLYRYKISADGGKWNWDDAMLRKREAKVLEFKLDGVEELI